MSKNNRFCYAMGLMDRLEKYTLIFFDFDGLLVNTEHLHFEAYKALCKNRGFSLDWDFARYCSIAHASSLGLRNRIYEDLPLLYQEEPDWAVLYAEKKECYRKILLEGCVELMPGVSEMIELLSYFGLRSCVVTNSFKEQTDEICRQLPLLQKLPHWITREDYENPKPAPDPYLAAIAKWAKPSDRIVGFEDTLRGIESLRLAGVEGVVISSCLGEESKKQLEGVTQFSSFLDLLRG